MICSKEKLLTSTNITTSINGKFLEETFSNENKYYGPLIFYIINNKYY